LTKKCTIFTLKQMKKRGTPISALTAYDYFTAQFVDEAGIDIILVGDSLGMVVQGKDSTLTVTMDEMVYHSRLVGCAVKSALVVTDMPYGSYQHTISNAVKNAIRLVKEGRSDAVKLEGGRKRTDVIKAILGAEIPVMGHIGLTPQSVNKLGGFKIQGKRMAGIDDLIQDALALQKAGCFCIVLEGIPKSVGRVLTNMLQIPTIGIGAGPYCDGQILVFHDMMGLNPVRQYRFVRRYAQVAETISEALIQYQNDIREGSFPSFDESFSLDASTLKELEEKYGSHLKDK